MTQSKREKTNYPGVCYRVVENTAIGKPKKVYYIRYKKNGKLFEEKVGGQYSDDITPAKAALYRADRISGKVESRKEIRDKRNEEKRKLLEKPTMEFIWKHYAEHNKAKRNTRTNGYVFKNHLGKFHKLLPSEVTTAHVRELRKNVEDKGLAPQSTKHVLALLRILLRHAVRFDLCEGVELSKIHFEMPHVDNVKTEVMTPEQLIAFRNALDEEADQNAASLIRLALVTGIRRGALMNLQWADIDFERGFISLRGEVAKKGKTEKIPLSSSARYILENMPRIGESIYLFPGKNGGPRKEIRHIANRVKKKAGLPDDFRPLHGLRHTYASLLASSGRVDLYTLQKLLTHSSPAMTQRYAHLADEAMHRAASVVDDIFERKEEDEEG